MKSNMKRLMSLALAMFLCISATGCKDSHSDSRVYMNYGTGLDEYGRYNAEFFGMNGRTDVDGADPGVVYVSKEEDPEWGGYYYRFITSDTTAVPNTEYYQENEIQALAYYCDRSEDLYHWETAGALAGGYSLAVDKLDWCGSNFWAPEVIRNPNDGKYYMYFNAAAKTDFGSEYVSNSENYMDRFYIGVAVSDTPVGPFDLICDYDMDTGKRIPTINFQTAYDLDFNIAAIDAHAFFDDDGQLYLYFVRHPDDHWNNGNVLAVMQMKSMAYADYSTARVIADAGCAYVEGVPGDLMNFTRGEAYFSGESGVNEGPYMYKHNGLYYLTYSSNGFGHISYSVHQAIGESPLGPFRKLDQASGNPVHDGSMFGDVHGTAHHSLVKNGSELWIVYHRHATIYGGVGWGRPTAADRVNFVENKDGIEVMTSNGPSRTLTWLPENVSGYENLAQTAQISIDNGTGVQYLTDNVIPLYEVASNYKMSVAEDNVTITLSWQEPVSVSALMVYNATVKENAFSQVADVRFKLAEKPQWASKDYDWAVIKDLQLQAGSWNAESEDFLEGAPAVAIFDEIKVSEIQITIDGKDLLVKHDKQGKSNTGFDISEIVVLGGGAENE